MGLSRRTGGQKRAAVQGPTVLGIPGGDPAPGEMCNRRRCDFGCVVVHSRHGRCHRHCARKFERWRRSIRGRGSVRDRECGHQRLGVGRRVCEWHLVCACQYSGDQKGAVTASALLSWRAIGSRESGGVCRTASCLSRLVAWSGLGHLAGCLFAARTRVEHNVSSGGVTG